MTRHMTITHADHCDNPNERDYLSYNGDPIRQCTTCRRYVLLNDDAGEDARPVRPRAGKVCPECFTRPARDQRPGRDGRCHECWTKATNPNRSKHRERL